MTAEDALDQCIAKFEEGVRSRGSFALMDIVALELKDKFRDTFVEAFKDSPTHWDKEKQYVLGESFKIGERAAESAAARKSTTVDWLNDAKPAAEAIVAENKGKNTRWCE